jgi:hypothetical protein
MRIDALDVFKDTHGIVKCHGDSGNTGDLGFEIFDQGFEHGLTVWKNNQVKNFYLNARRGQR